MNASDAPRVSVVIPTFNRRDRLRRVLAALAAQDVDESFEVIVVSDGSTDGTDDDLRADDVALPVTAVLQHNRGPAAARNAGVAKARGELIVFIDDDVVPEPSLLRAHLAAHQGLGDQSVVIGPMLDPPDHTMSPWVSWEQAMLAKQYDDMSAGKYTATARQFYTGNASVRRQYLLAVGGFDTEFRRAEDVELAFRLEDLGIEFHFEPNARAWHYAERSYDSWKSAAYLYGRNEIVFARDRGRAWIYEFRRRAFSHQHPGIRLLIRRGIASPTWHGITIGALEPVAVHVPVQRVSRVALSGVYALEFHRGMADELGSAAALDAVLTSGSPDRSVPTSR